MHGNGLAEDADFREIFNMDQGSSFKFLKFKNVLTDKDITNSMNGRNNTLHNIFIERLWRSVKYGCIYINVYENEIQLNQELDYYFRFYNTKKKY